MAKFRELKKHGEHSGQDEAMVDNYRPVQKLNNREVFVTYSSAASAHLLGSTAAATCLAALVSALSARY